MSGLSSFEPLSEPTPEPTRPGRVVLAAAVAFALALVAAAAFVPLLVRAATPPADLSQVMVFEGLDLDHTDGEVDYLMSPPAGGPHAPEWLACGAYDTEVPEENAVHSLEHGTVWITYDPSLAADEVASLEASLPAEGILSPYDGLPSDVVVTVWGRQLALEGADDPRLSLFLTEFGDGHTAPEPFASCEGGVDESGSPSMNA